MRIKELPDEEGYWWNQYFMISWVKKRDNELYISRAAMSQKPCLLGDEHKGKWIKEIVPELEDFEMGREFPNSEGYWWLNENKGGDILFQFLLGGDFGNDLFYGAGGNDFWSDRNGFCREIKQNEGKWIKITISPEIFKQ